MALGMNRNSRLRKVRDMVKHSSRIFIDNWIVFEDCFVVLLSGPDNEPFLKNNVLCIDLSGHERWNIKEVIHYPQPDYEDAYVALSRKSDHTFSLVSFGGISFVINIDTLKIEEKQITK